MHLRLLQNQVFFRQSAATALEGHSAVSAPLQPTLDPSQLLMLATHHYQSQPHQPPAYPQPYPLDSHNSADAAKHAHTAAASYGSSHLVPADVSAQDPGNQWAAAEAGSNGLAPSGPGIDPRLGVLLATLQNGQAAPVQLMPRNPSFTSAARQGLGNLPKQPHHQQSLTAQPNLHQKAQPQEQQQQPISHPPQQQQLQRQPPHTESQQHQQQQQRQQASSAGTKQSAEGQASLSPAGLGWVADPGSMQALQAMLQQTRPQRAWVGPEVGTT